MTEFCFSFPTTLCHGRDCVQKNEDKLCALGNRALLVTGRSGARLSGALDDVTAALDKGGVTWKLFDGVEENPSLETCAAGALTAIEFKADFVVGVGGGSALDAAKAMAVMATGRYERPEQVFEPLRAGPLPVAAVATTAGTGSEVNSIAVLTADGGRLKSSIRHVAPRLAFTDPKYLKKLPESVMNSCALDAFCHGLESFMLTHSNPMSEMLALRAVCLLWSALKALARGDAGEDELDALSLGASLGGMAIQETGTAMPHPMGYSLTLDCGVPHGAACAVFLPYFITRSCQAAPERMEQLSELIGVLPNEISALTERLHGVSLKLTAKQAKDFTARVAASRQFTSGYFQMNATDIEALYMQMFS